MNGFLRRWDDADDELRQKTAMHRRIESAKITDVERRADP
jgi:hypothetical protein